MNWTPREGKVIERVEQLATRHNHRKVVYAGGSADIVPEADYLPVEAEVLAQVRRKLVEADGASRVADVWRVTKAADRDKVRQLLESGDWVQLGARRFEIQADGTLLEYVIKP